ncbi:hypothetical protein J9236_13915, partial [Providencia rettgeri]|uniref:hypothetical protein n=1 Tax=Providencia rettgeri TaxID=587 RepID=UPI001B37D3A8
LYNTISHNNVNGFEKHFHQKMLSIFMAMLALYVSPYLTLLKIRLFVGAIALLNILWRVSIFS